MVSDRSPRARRFAADLPLGSRARWRTHCAQLVRPVRLVAAGGTIAMRGATRRPAVDAAELVRSAAAARRRPEAQGRDGAHAPSAQIEPRAGAGPRPTALARRPMPAMGVVITTGTDTMEELAVLCAMTDGGEARS